MYLLIKPARFCCHMKVDKKAGENGVQFVFLALPVAEQRYFKGDRPGIFFWRILQAFGTTQILGYFLLQYFLNDTKIYVFCH